MPAAGCTQNIVLLRILIILGEEHVLCLQMRLSAVQSVVKYLLSFPELCCR